MLRDDTAFPNALALIVSRLKASLALLMLIFARLFPKELNQFVLSHFYGIRLHVDTEDSFDGVSISRFKYGAKSAFCISMDFEIPIHKQLERLKISQQATYELLKIAESYDIPITWAVCGNILAKPSTYRDSFKQIIASKGKHELASHTFSHIDLSNYGKKAAEREILSSSEALSEYMPPTSFVFPYEKEAHHRLVAKSGFTAYRGATAVLGYPKKFHHMWHIYQTYFFTGRSSDFAAFTLRLLLFCLLDLAIKYGCALHIWSHPWAMDVQKDAERFNENVLRPLFSYIAKKREKGLVWTCTMQELANYCEARKNCTLNEYSKGKDEISVNVRCKIDDYRFDSQPTVTLRFRVPKRKSIKAFINGDEAKFNRNLLVTKKLRTTHVRLNVNFDKPFESIRIQMR